jgi:transcriptional regulator with PAS, ATPase and Fis domain
MDTELMGKEQPNLLLSSIIRNSERTVTDRTILTEDNIYIERVKQLKLEILRGVAEPVEVELVHPEIKDSWSRSSGYGVDMHQPVRSSPAIPPADLDNLLVENRFLINATLSNLRQFMSLHNGNYDFFLFDPHGVNLLTMFAENNYIAYEGFGLAPGTVWNEKTVGTTSMSLVPLLKQPIQCVGPENYLAEFHIVTGSSAPIFDIKGELAGILSVGTVYYQCVNSLNLSFAVSIAALVQKDFQLAVYEDMYKKQQSNRIGSGKRALTIAGTKDPFAAVVGTSAPLKETVALARRFAREDDGILLQGESGVGKELFAQAIHSISRPGRPFVAVNCGAIPKTLAESELFGYEGGSFTGAEHKGRKGKIEHAGGGTLFLDEIGDLPLELQPILLRVLEEKQVTRVGGTRALPVDFHLIAATNQNLSELMRQGLFREDLYYRLAIFRIMIPPLRDRDQDILLLCEYFLAEQARKRGVPALRLSRAAKTALLCYAWPGNVRQLANSMKYAACGTSDEVIRPEHLPAEIRVGVTAAEQGEPAEVEIIREALQQSEHNLTATARLLGLSRATLYRKLNKYPSLKT